MVSLSLGFKRYRRRRAISFHSLLINKENTHKPAKRKTYVKKYRPVFMREYLYTISRFITLYSSIPWVSVFTPYSPDCCFVHFSNNLDNLIYGSFNLIQVNSLFEGENLG